MTLQVDGRDILRRAFDMRVISRMTRRPEAAPEDGPSYAQGVVNGVAAVLETLIEQNIPVNIEGVDLTQVAAEIRRTDP